MSTGLILPPLRFKGERSYIQGPDLFNAMQVAARERLGHSAWVERAVIREMATGPVEVAEGDVDGAKGVFDSVWTPKTSAKSVSYNWAD